MKRVAAIIIIGCLLASAVPAYAGRWQVSGYVASGGVTTHGWSGSTVHFSNSGKLMPPSEWPHHGPCIYYPGWSGVGYTGHPYWWGTYPWAPPVYYRTPVYVVTPWVDSSVTVITGSDVGYAAIVDEGPVIRSGGVYAVRVSAPPVEPVERLDGVSGGVQMPSAWTSPDRPRRNLDGTLRVFKAGGIDRAEAELGKLLRSNPSDAQLSYVYAYVLFLREKYATASFVLRRALILDGELAEAGRQALEGFYDAPRTTEGLARLNRYVEANPGDASARLVRAYVLFLGDRKDAAREDLAAALKADSSDEQAALLLKLCTPEGKTSP
jgi:hypothetical protein